MNKTLIHAAALAALVTAWPALAQKAGSGDGVVTITQAKAVNGGVTPGDAPGFPVSITQPGSYRLAGNLTLTDPNVGAIEILAAGVTLDLGGFTVQGPNACSPNPGGPGLVCTYPGSGPTPAGVALGPGSEGSTVRNGRLSGFRGDGIHGYAEGTRIDTLTVSDNGNVGVFASQGVSVSSIVARRNAGHGVYAIGAVVRDAVVDGNGSTGVRLSGGLLVRSVVTRNGGHGLWGDGQSSGYRETVFFANASGAGVAGLAKSLGDNLCDGSPC